MKSDFFATIQFAMQRRWDMGRESFYSFCRVVRVRFYPFILCSAAVCGLIAWALSVWAADRVYTSTVVIKETTVDIENTTYPVMHEDGLGYDAVPLRVLMDGNANSDDESRQPMD